MSEVPETDRDDAEQPLIAHLIELRARLLRSLLCVLLVFVVLAGFANDIYYLVAIPLLAKLPPGSSMIATEVAAPFLVPFKLCIYVAVLVSIPYLLYQLWAFIAPGLYRNERRFVFPLLVSSSLLFYAGVAFAYFAAFPLLFGFFTAAAPEGVTVMTDIAQYLGFAMKMFLAFGVAFEVPIATLLLVWTGLVSAATLGRLRPYIIVGAFIVGALLTPPDVLSQCLLSIPIWLLFELGLLVSRLVLPRDAGQGSENGGSTEGSKP